MPKLKPSVSSTSILWYDLTVSIAQNTPRHFNVFSISDIRYWPMNAFSHPITLLKHLTKAYFERGFSQVVALQTKTPAFMQIQ